MSVSLSPDGKTIADDCPVLSTEFAHAPRTLSDLELRIITERQDTYKILRPTIGLLERYWNKRVKPGTESEQDLPDIGDDPVLDALFLEIWIRGFRPFLNDEIDHTAYTKNSYGCGFTRLRKFAEECGYARHIPEPWRRMIALAQAKGCPEFADYFAANTEDPGAVTIPNVEKFVRLLARFGGHSWSTATDRKYKFLKLLRDEGFVEKQPLAAIRDNDYGVQPEKMPDIPLKKQTERFRSFILSGCTVNCGNSKWEPKPWNTPTVDDLKREEGTGTRRPGTAKLAVDAIAWVFGFAKQEYHVVIESLEELLDEDLFLSFRNWALRVRLRTGDSLRNPLATLFANLKRWREFEQVDLSWTDKLLDEIPRTTQGERNKRKEEKYLSLKELDEIPGPIKADRVREETRLREAEANERRLGDRRSPIRLNRARLFFRSQTKLIFRLVLAEFVFRFQTLWAWRESNLCNCRLDGDDPNLFKGPIKRTPSLHIPPEVEEILKGDPTAEFWQVHIGPREHKTGRITGMEFKAVFPLELVPALEEFLKYRDEFLLFMEKSCTTLLVNERGNPYKEAGLIRLVKDMAFKYGGAPMNPHLFRDALGNDTMIHHPEDSQKVATGLLHTSDETLKRAYSGCNSASVGVNALNELARSRREKREKLHLELPGELNQLQSRI